MSTKTCFVVMGFGEKTDYQTQRTLDLDKTYRGIIKPAVEQCGLQCIRADDIIHAGVIDKPMYEHLLGADLVIADLSTANPNAIYELGVRHSLRPNTTIVIAESAFKFPFDLAHVMINMYEHLGKGIDFEEADRIKNVLMKTINELVHGNAQVDSPVYTFLADLIQPTLKPVTRNIRGESTAIGNQPDDEAFGPMLEKAQEARQLENFRDAKQLFQQLHEIHPSDAYIVQQLAFATYKCPQDDEAARVGALETARRLIATELHPASTNDPETLGLWGAIHKRLWELSGGRADLDTAVWSYERGFYLKRDHYNGINYAFMLNERAKQQSEVDESTADIVTARRIRKEILNIVDDAEKKIPRNESGKPIDAGEAYWIAATRLEALLGLGEADRFAEEAKILYATAPESWMPDSTNEQLEKLKKLL